MNFSPINVYILLIFYQNQFKYNKVNLPCLSAERAVQLLDMVLKYLKFLPGDTPIQAGQNAVVV